MLSPAELGWDLGLIAQGYLAERAAVIADLSRRLARRVLPADVHHMRIACRRMREAIDFFQAAPERPDLATVRRRAWRMMAALGPLREAHVAARLLEDLWDGPLDQRAEQARRWLRRQSGRQRKRLARRHAGRIARRGRRLRRALAGSGLRPPAPPIDGAASAAAAEPRTRAFLEARMAERRAAVEELAARLPRRGRAIDPDLAHRIRVAVKHWRYASEIGRPALSLERRTALAGRLRHLQDLGGRSQDLDDLVRRVEKTIADRGGSKRFEALLQQVVAAREAALCEFLDALRADLAVVPLTSSLSRAVLPA